MPSKCQQQALSIRVLYGATFPSPHIRTGPGSARWGGKQRAQLRHLDTKRASVPGDMSVDEFGRSSMPQGLIVGFYFLSEDVVVVLVLIVTF